MTGFKKKKKEIGKIEFQILIAPGGSIYTFNAKSNNEIDVYGFVSVVSATAGNSTKPNILKKRRAIRKK